MAQSTIELKVFVAAPMKEGHDAKARQLDSLCGVRARRSAGCGRKTHGVLVL